jgi:hypothetical protein
MPDKKIVELIESMPNADKNAKPDGPPRSEVESKYDTILTGGRQVVVGVVDLLKPDAEQGDYKARQALFNTAWQAGKQGNEKIRASFAASLAGELSADRDSGIKRYLLELLRICATDAQAPAIGKLLDDKELYDDAALTLLRIGKAGASHIRKAAQSAKGIARLTMLQNLGELGDKQSVVLLRSGTEDSDAHVRVTAALSLSKLGDAGSVQHVLKVADAKDVDSFERRNGTKAALVLAENLADAGKKDEAAKIYKHLFNSRTDVSERYVRQAATIGLEQIE